MRTQTTQEANRLMEQQHLGGIGGDVCDDSRFDDIDDCVRCQAELSEQDTDGICESCNRELRKQELVEE